MDYMAITLHAKSKYNTCKKSTKIALRFISHDSIIHTPFRESELVARGHKVQKAARGRGKYLTFDIIQTQGLVSSQADGRGLHISTMPGVNIHFDIGVVCYFHRLTFSSSHTGDDFYISNLFKILNIHREQQH